MRDDVDAAKLFADRIDDSSAPVRRGDVRGNEGFRFGMADRLRAAASTIAPSSRKRVTTSANASRGAGHEGASALQFSWH
jgi:hypothetical protein